MRCLIQHKENTRYSSYEFSFIFGFSFLFFILNLGKEYNMMSGITVTQVTRYDRGMTYITGWSHMLQVTGYTIT